MKRILNPREKLILYLTVGVIIFGVVFNFLIAPVMDKNDALNSQINLNRAKLKRYLQLLAEKDSIEQRYARSAGNLKSAEEDSALVSGFDEIEALAKSANILIVDIRPQGGSKKTSLYKENLIDVRVEGTMEGFLKFMYDLENSLYLLRIKRFQLNTKLNSQNLEGVFSISQLLP